MGVPYCCFFFSFFRFAVIPCNWYQMRSLLIAGILASVFRFRANSTRAEDEKHTSREAVVAFLGFTLNLIGRSVFSILVCEPVARLIEYCLVRLIKYCLHDCASTKRDSTRMYKVGCTVRCLIPC